MPRELTRAAALRSQGALAGLNASLGARPADSSGAADRFAELLVDKIEHVHQSQGQANALVARMLAGQDVPPAEAQAAVQQAEIAFRTLVQIRDRVVEAYRELQQIQV